MADDRAQVLEDSRRLIRERRPAGAVALLQSWLTHANDDVTAWALLAAAHSEAGDWPAAETAARRVVKLRPDVARGWANWGVTLRKLDRPDDAEKALRKALSLDPDSATAKRELRKLERTPPSADAQDTCPACGERVYPTDTQCLACGADLLAARAELRREAEARERAQAAARDGARRQAVEQQVEAMRAAGFDDQQAYGRLISEGWSEADVRRLLGIDEAVWVVTLPESRYAFVGSVDDAKSLRAEALARVGELRAEVKSINQQIGDVRSEAHAAYAARRPDAEADAAKDDLAERATLTMLEGMRDDAVALAREWEVAADGLDAWIGRSY